VTALVDKGKTFGNCRDVIAGMYCNLDEGICDIMRAVCGSINEDEVGDPLLSMLGIGGS